jgi:pyruvate,orthophosphate dikinase
LAVPAVWLRLNEICRELEMLFCDAQDFEFTIQSGELFLLQTRRAKRTDWAALTIAVDMVEEELIKPIEALARLNGIKLDSVIRSSFALPLPETLAVAQVAGMGVTSGAIALDSAAVQRLSAAVVARQLGKVCLVGCANLEIDLGKRQCHIGAKLLNEGDFLSLDGNTGAMYLGRLASLIERPERPLAAIASWSPAAVA